MSYDESLLDNPFFKAIQGGYTHILEEALAKNWIICVPRAGTIRATSLSQTDVFAHVLIPNGDTGFTTLSNQKVTVQDGGVTLHGDGKNIQILFEETCYTDGLRKYKLWCLEGPLNRDVPKLGTHHTTECDDFVVSCIDAAVEDFLKDEIQFENVTVLQKRFLHLYDTCKRGLTNSKCNSDIERYIGRRIHGKLFRAVCNVTCKEDACFNRTVRGLAHVQLRDLQVPRWFFENILEAKHILSDLNKQSDAHGKIECLRRVFYTLSTFKVKNGTDHHVTCDDLIKVFVFLVVKSNLNNWLANLMYVTRFRINLAHLRDDEDTFLTSTLEAAIEFVKLPPEDDSLVRQGDMEAIRASFDDDRLKENNQDGPGRCHPLCSCDACERFTLDNDDKGRSPLHVACMHGRLDAAEYFVSKGFPVDTVDNSESTPLHYAAAKDRRDVLLFLLRSNANPALADHEGNTALHVACNNGHESCVETLLSFKSEDVNVCNNFGNAPLHLASKWGYLGIVCALLQHGATVGLLNVRNQTAYDVAHNDYVKQLLWRSHRVQNKDEKRTKRINLLLKSVENDDLPLTCYYLGVSRKREDVEVKTCCHPLCTCDACREQFEIGAHGEDVDACDSEGRSCMHVAAKWGRTDIVRLLLRHGASVNLKTLKDRRTPLHFACIHGRVEVVGILLGSGVCDVDARDAKGTVSLEYARLNNHTDIVDLLVNHGMSRVHI